jgi:hypothetical protein
LQSKEWRAILIPANPSAYSQALHTIHPRLMEVLMGTQEVREGEEAELRRVDRGVLGTIETSFEILRIGRLRKDSWVRANGID